MAKKYYAVRAGRKTGIFETWDECRAQTTGFKADCVSGGEIRAAIKAGFPANKIVFAGVGKADWEINLGLDYDIFCFNVKN